MTDSGGNESAAYRFLASFRSTQQRSRGVRSVDRPAPDRPYHADSQMAAQAPPARNPVRRPCRRRGRHHLRRPVGSPAVGGKRTPSRSAGIAHVPAATTSRGRRRRAPAVAGGSWRHGTRSGTGRSVQRFERDDSMSVRWVGSTFRLALLRGEPSTLDLRLVPSGRLTQQSHALHVRGHVRHVARVEIVIRVAFVRPPALSRP